MPLVNIPILRRYVLIDTPTELEIKINGQDLIKLNPGRYQLDTAEGIKSLEVSDDSNIQYSPVGLGFLSALDGMPVQGPLTNGELRSSAVEIIDPATMAAATGSGSLSVDGPLTNAELRAAAVPVSLASVPSHAVTGPLTDTQLRQNPVQVIQSKKQYIEYDGTPDSSVRTSLSLSNGIYNAKGYVRLSAGTTLYEYEVFAIELLASSIKIFGRNSSNVGTVLSIGTVCSVTTMKDAQASASPAISGPTNFKMAILVDNK